MLRHLACSAALTASIAFTAVPVAAQVVSFGSVELAFDGSNLDTSGVQVIGHNASGNAVSSNDINWDLNSASVTPPGGGIGDRNNPVGGPPDPYSPLDVPGGAAETFAAGSFASIDPYHDPTASGVESGLHDAIESILFGGSFEITIADLTPGDDYRVQLISWDAGVEGEGDGEVGTTKEYRYSTIAASSAGASGSSPYNQFVVDGTAATSADNLYGNSSDEITAALITAEFTAASSEITFTLAIDDAILNSLGNVSNDNAIYNALSVHNLTIPEPASAVLSALGMVVATGLRRRA